ncbi:hypothetical protein WDU94_003828 [Cyamophila willieti]
MVQELQVLKCYSCSTFQVHIVKKAKKWECKLCHEKQSIKEVFGRGSGKDCRVHVQKLNALRATREGNNLTDDQFSAFLVAPRNCVPDLVSPQPTSSNVINKWDKYLDNDDGEESPEEDNRHLLEGTRNQKRKRRKVCNDESGLVERRKKLCVKDNDFNTPTQQDTGSVPYEHESNGQFHETFTFRNPNVPMNNTQPNAPINNTQSHQYGMGNHNSDYKECINQSQLRNQIKSSQLGSSKTHQSGSVSKPTTHLQENLKASVSASSKWSKYLTNEDDNEFFETEKSNEEVDNVEIPKNSNVYNKSPGDTNENTTQLFEDTHSTFNNTHKNSDDRLEFLQDILNIKTNNEHHGTSKMENNDKLGFGVNSNENKHPKENIINSRKCSLFEEPDDALLDELLGDC